ncbi:MAG: diaminopimelate decarboxylase [Rickettsiales bacterium]
MKNLSYKNHNNKTELFIENVALSKIAKSIGTPFYAYSRLSLFENYENFVEAFEFHKIFNYKICYAIKANYNVNLVKILANLGSGVDAVSAGEIYRAIEAGINPQKIVFAGVGKTREDMIFAFENGVEEFSVESIEEMFLLNEVAINLGKIAKFSVRVNPDVDAKTHDKISTGRKGDKFGIDFDNALEVYNIASKLSGLEIYGIAMHIGSQIIDLNPFEKAFYKLKNLYSELTKLGFKIKNLDFGGGIGINYKNESTIDIIEYVGLIKKIIAGTDVSVTIAPGRAIVGNAGLLVTKTIFHKETPTKNFVIIDGAINDLMRPGLYGSYHEVIPVEKRIWHRAKFDFAGPVCESTDILAKDREIVVPRIGDLFAFLSAGAYGSSMSSEYNCRPLVPEVLIDDNEFKIIRKRPTFKEMLRLEENL